MAIDFARNWKNIVPGIATAVQMPLNAYFIAAENPLSLEGVEKIVAISFGARSSNGCFLGCL